jgi:hypothetical protein
MEATKHKFTTKLNLTLQNSFGTLAREDGVELEITIGVRGDRRGWFEMFDAATHGDAWYAEGSLRFDENLDLVDYDGVFSLPAPIMDKLDELGYSTAEMRRMLAD